MKTEIYSQSRNAGLLLYLVENGITQYDQDGIRMAVAHFGYHWQSVSSCAERNNNLLQKCKKMKTEIAHLKAHVFQISKQETKVDNSQLYIFDEETIGRGENWGSNRDLEILPVCKSK